MDARVRHLGGQGERDGSRPRAQIDGDRCGPGGGAEEVDRDLGHRLGLGAWDENPGSDPQLEMAEGSGAGEVLQRFTGGAPGDEVGIAPRGSGGDLVATEQRRRQLAPFDVENVRREELGIDPRGRHERRLELDRRGADEVGQTGTGCGWGAHGRR